MNNYTPEDLLEYYYQETSPEKSSAIANAIKASWVLQQKFDVISQAAESLDKSIRGPRPQSIQFILNYAGEHSSEAVEWFLKVYYLLNQ